MQKPLSVTSTERLYIDFLLPDYSSMIQSSHKNIVSSLKYPDKGVFFIPKS